MEIEKVLKLEMFDIREEIMRLKGDPFERNGIIVTLEENPKGYVDVYIECDDDKEELVINKDQLPEYYIIERHNVIPSNVIHIMGIGTDFLKISIGRELKL